VDDWDLRNQDPSNTVFAKTFKTRGEAMDAAMAAFPEWEEGRPPKIKKADTYKALNRLIQPSGAQLMKHGMVLVSRSGATDVLGPALVSVHDELGMSVPRSREGREAFLEVSRCLQGADEGESKVPMLIGAEVGENWGALTEIEDLGAWARAPRKKLRKR